MLIWRVSLTAALLVVTAMLASVRYAPPQAAVAPARPVTTAAGFTFALVVDQREYAGEGHDSNRYFRGVAEAMRARGPIAFIVSPGDIDPPGATKWTLDQVFAGDYWWFPGVGNHEAETPADMGWLRAYTYDPNGPGLEPDVRPGPAGCPQTTYSFDYQNAHFVMLNLYCDASGDTTATEGEVTDHLYDWLSNDLAATTKPFKFVLGHEPAFPQPDVDNGRSRHVGDSLDQFPSQRDRFWTLLRSSGVVAYLTGHSHNFSATTVDGVWQVDGGHARGDGDQGAPSTFVLVHVGVETVIYEAYRETFDGVYDYDDVVHRGALVGPAPTPLPTGVSVRTLLPFVMGSP